MASRYYHEFPERKITAPTSKTAAPSGPRHRGVSERTAAWPAKPRGGSDFNRRTKADVVKAWPKKAGLP